MANESVRTLLSDQGIHPVLIDVGASGTPPAVWNTIRNNSIYVGFDPDLREIRDIQNSGYYKATIINEAITDDASNGEVRFYLTQSPYCSSTLKPDTQSLENYLFSDLFTVENESSVKAITLNEAVQRVGVSSIDWLKLDTQGTDLRIFTSLDEKTRRHVLAIDIEPGLIDAYIGEDLFVDVHRELTQNGFWLSNLNVEGAVRVRRSSIRDTLPFLPDKNYSLISKAIRTSPSWCEARYFRSLQFLAQNDFTARDYIVLWAFALADNQYGFALDIGIECQKRFGQDPIGNILKTTVISQIERVIKRESLLKPFKKVVRAALRQFGR
ncbi:MAG: FkbM family methyltransferase [Chloroflexota bacterium]